MRSAAASSHGLLDAEDSEQSQTVLTYEEFCGRLTPLLPEMRRFATFCCGSAQDADDLVQAACEKALGRWSQWTGRAPLKHWILKIIANGAKDGFRSQWTRIQRLADGDTNEDVPSTFGSMPERAVYAEQVLIAASQLPPVQRDILQLIVVEEMSYQHAADALRIPIGTVMSRLSRAREALKEKLAAADRASPTDFGR
jgi:RNA polymerase sigma-70 factor (ECF subfamily)